MTAVEEIGSNISKIIEEARKTGYIEGINDLLNSADKIFMNNENQIIIYTTSETIMKHIEK
jgi:hypothetical protein